MLSKIASLLTSPLTIFLYFPFFTKNKIKRVIMKYNIPKIMLILISLLIFSCSQKENKPLKIGISPNMKPYMYLDKDKNVKGFEYQFINEFCKKYKYSPIFIQDNIPNHLKALKDNKIDLLISGVSFSEERNKIFSLSKPYYDADPAVISLQEKYAPIQNLDEVQNYKVCVLIGSSGQYLIDKMLIDNPLMKPDKVIKVRSYTDMLNCLNEGKADLALMDKTLAEYFKTDYKLAISMTCDTGELFSVFMPENSDLKAKINRFIKKSLKSKNYIILLKECFLNKEI